MVGIRNIDFNPQGARLWIDGIAGAGYFSIEFAISFVAGLNFHRRANPDIICGALWHVHKNADGNIFYYPVKRRGIGFAGGNQIADVDMTLRNRAVVRRCNLLELRQRRITVDNRLIETDLCFRLV